MGSTVLPLALVNRRGHQDRVVLLPPLADDPEKTRGHRSVPVGACGCQPPPNAPARESHGTRGAMANIYSPEQDVPIVRVVWPMDLYLSMHP